MRSRDNRSRARAKNAAPKIIVAIALLPLGIGAIGACANEVDQPVIQRTIRAAVSENGAAIFSYEADLDHRISSSLTDSDGHKVDYYPDDWSAGFRAIIDFKADTQHLFVVLTSETERDNQRLFRIERRSGLVRGFLDLPAKPKRLSWSNGGLLLVGHFSPSQGASGRVSVVDVQRWALRRTISLQGECIALSGAQHQAYGIERVSRVDRDDHLVKANRIVSIDLAHGRITRRIPVPPGARHLAIGPTGLLYVSHASSRGTLVSDGTITVIDPQTGRFIDRLDTGMLIRFMAPSKDYLVISTLTESGDALLSAIDRNHRTTSELQVPGLVGRDIAIVGNNAFIPTQSGNTLTEVDLKQGRVIKVHRPAIRGWPGVPIGRTPPTLLRTVFSPIPSRPAVKTAPNGMHGHVE